MLPAMIGSPVTGAIRRNLAISLTHLLTLVALSLRFYRLSPLWALALPFMAGFYAWFTLDSALQYWRGYRCARAQGSTCDNRS